MTRVIKRAEDGRNSVTMKQVRISGKTSYHICLRQGLLYKQCAIRSDIDAALDIYDRLLKKMHE